MNGMIGPSGEFVLCPSYARPTITPSSQALWHCVLNH